MPRPKKAPPPPPEPKRHAHARGKGSQRVLPSGRVRAWKAQVGGGPRESKTFDTDAAATAWRLGLEPAPPPGPSPADQSLEDYLDDWIDRQAAGWPPGTASSRRATIKHAAPIWHLGVSELRPSHARECVAEMQRAGLTNRYARGFLGLLRMALEGLVEDGVLARNPVPTLKRGELPITEPPRVVWSNEDLGKWMAETYRHPWGVLFRIAARRGMRPAELRGLKWSDFNLAGGMLTLRRNLNDGRREGPTKNRKERPLRLLPEEVTELRAYRIAQAVVSEWVVCGPDGRPRSRKTWEREFEALRSAAGVAPASPKVLRHSAATHLPRMGVSIRKTAEILGHHSPAFTVSRYGAPLASEEDEAMGAMADLGAERDPGDDRGRVATPRS